MFCPKCGKETDASGKFCQWCGADIETDAALAPVAIPDEEDRAEVGICAGLGRRFIAFIVDMILVLLIGLTTVAGFGLFRGLQNAFFYGVQHIPADQLTTEGTMGALVASIIAAYGVLLVIVPWLYFAGFESARSQATPGKVLMRLIVTDMQGQKPTFARTTLRFFGKFISTLIIFLGYLMIGFTKKHQGLHDKIAGCLVLLQDE